LERLYLDDNFISIIPREIAKVSHLRVLSMKSNPIEYFPDELMGMGALETLSIPRTGFSSDKMRTLFFNVTAESFPALKEINMENYQLPTLSSKFFECTSYVLSQSIYLT
jgi:Leucine-rich repeat (LRR) protein